MRKSFRSARNLTNMKVLLLDIETAPNIAYVWRLFKENISLKQLKESSYVMCWSAKWLDGEEVMYDSEHDSGMRAMLVRIHSLLDEADVVVHYNGASFDIPTLNKEFVLHHLGPPSPYKQVDLINTVRDKFRFVSNKMDYVCRYLGIGEKKETDFTLWVDCMDGKREAWRRMAEYNIHDVRLLEALYYRLRPWIRNHPNIALYSEARQCCPNCGELKIQKRGFAYTTVGKFQRYWCPHCGNWSKSGENLMKATKEIVRNAA